jgi:2-polyprenyl-3-methyl-5-hydroxy-6-metoxy-1,4-benzoquinol methylase
MSTVKAAAAGKRLFEQCPIGCAASLEASGISLKEGPLLRCPSCGHLVSSCTGQAHEASLGQWDSPGGTKPHPRSVARYRQVTARRLRSALRLLRTGSDQPRLLDVGCSSGALLGIATDLGFKVAGVEPAASAAKAAQRAGFEVFDGFLHEAHYPDETFDVITLFEIIEHVANPVDLIVECRRILKRGGVLALNTPNAASWTAMFMAGRWDGFSLTGMGGHVSFFSPSSIRQLARRANLAVAGLETRNVRFYEKSQCHFLVYAIAKNAAQLAALPARIAGRGHDLLVYLVREAD